MAIPIPNFTTTAVINGSTLVSQADEQLNIMMDDIKDYVESTYDSIATTLENSIADDVLLAEKWATEAENVEVQSGEFSAYHWAQKAKDYAGGATTADWEDITNKPTTVDGYGITDAYTKTEVQTVLPKIGFDTTNVTVPGVGQVAWNIDENTLDLGLNGATLQFGQEQLIRVRNNTGSAILNGKAVMATGTLGASGRITIALANITQANAKYILGIVTEDIAAGADGFCTTFGKIRGIQTNGANYGESWTDGDVLYVKDSGSGALTKVTPTDIQVKLPIAIVINSHPVMGTLFVRVNSIDENHAKAELALKADITYVDGLVGDINSALDTINGEVI